MAKNIEQLLKKLKELVPPTGKSKSVEYKFQVPKSIDAFKAYARKYRMDPLSQGEPVSGSEHLHLDIKSVDPVLFANQDLLRGLYIQSEPLVENSWIGVKVSSRELEGGEVPMEYIDEIDCRKGECWLKLGRNGFRQPVISLQSNSGIGRRKRIVKELGLNITGRYNAGKLVDMKSKKGREKVIEELRKGFTMLDHSNKRFIEVHFPGYGQKKMPAEKLPNFGEIYRIGLCNYISLGNGSNDINSLSFEYHYPYSIGTWKYHGKEETRMVISLVRTPVLLESQAKVIDAYGVVPK